MGMLSVTIFAFLIARSASPAHNKIFGAKFLSFERFEIMCFIHSVLCSSLAKRYEIRLANVPFFSAIEPLLHSNTVAVGIQ